MSTSLLYHAFGIRGYDYICTRYEKGGVIFTIRHKPKSIRCPLCGGRDQLKKRGTVPRLFWAPNISQRPVSIELAVQRVECLRCKTVRQVKLGFADPRYFHTRSFERYAVELSRRGGFRWRWQRGGGA